MSLPKMGKVLKRFEQPISIVTVVQTIVGVKPVETKTKHNIKAVVQVASNEVLKVYGIDYSQGLYQVHIRTELLNQLNINLKTIDEMTDYKNRNFKIKDTRDFNEYGYFEFICEEFIK